MGFIARFKRQPLWLKIWAFLWVFLLLGAGIVEFVLRKFFPAIPEEVAGIMIVGWFILGGISKLIEYKENPNKVQKELDEWICDPAYAGHEHNIYHDAISDDDD